MDWFRGTKKKKSDDYEKEYLARYKKEQKIKPKKKTPKYRKSIETESHEIDQKTKVETRKEEAEPLSTKFESVKQEYNITIKNLMNTKKELKNMKEDVEKSNNDYNDIIAKIKSARADLLKTNSELQEKTVESISSTEQTKKQSALSQEINDSKRELSKIKEQINGYKNELESVKMKVDNSPDAKKMKEERGRLEKEIMQKRKELDSGFRELKFIKDEMAKSGKKEGTDKIVDAASAVVASMNQKLQTTITELNAVKQALEKERAQRKKTT
mgnify:CR=1 FL=1